MDRWSKPTSHGIRIICNTENFDSYRGYKLVKFFLDIFIILTDTFETGESFFFLFFFVLTFFTNSRQREQEREREKKNGRKGEMKERKRKGEREINKDKQR